MVAYKFFLILMEIVVLEEVAMRCKAHATALQAACERLVLGVAAQVIEVPAQLRHHATTPFEVANKQLGLSVPG